MSRLPRVLFASLGLLASASLYASAGASASAQGVVVAHVDSADDKSDRDPAPAKNAGSIDGQVVAVDYGSGNISVKAAGMRYDIVVLPSTSIQGRTNNNFHTIADIHKGAHVQVIMSRKAGAYTAQIIRLY